MVATTKLSIPVQIEVNPDARDAYSESLKMILQHVAEFHITVVDIISEKYKIPVDEIMNTVTSDSRYTNMVTDPKIHRLTVLNKDQVETIVAATPIASIETISVTKAPTTKKTNKKNIKIIPKTAIILPIAST
jgi:hypothetical protein